MGTVESGLPVDTLIAQIRATSMPGDDNLRTLVFVRPSPYAYELMKVEFEI
jgi:hypothetical protein